MKTEHPMPEDIPALRQLWQEAFGDPDSYLDLFFSTAFLADHCLCIRQDEKLLAAAYWMDCSIGDTAAAYIYAVATAQAARRQGLCKKLMADIHALLQERGYGCAILVPGDGALRQMYRAMGYTDFGGIREFICEANTSATELQPIGVAEFATLRRQMLPKSGVLQEGAQLALLDSIAEFYRGDGFLLTRRKEDGYVLELLGQTAEYQRIAAAFGADSIRIRTNGEAPFGMYYPLNSQNAPSYFVFAFD